MSFGAPLVPFPASVASSQIDESKRWLPKGETFVNAEFSNQKFAQYLGKRSQKELGITHSARVTCILLARDS